MSRSKILVVDDEPDLVQLLQDWLEADGHQVFTATEAQQALKLFFEHRPALTITDLRMPGMDGFQFVSRIREVSEAHVLMLTAFDSEEYIIRGLGLGADGYLVKPLSRRVLLARVRAVLRRAEAPEEVPSTYSDSSLSMNYLTHEAHVRGQPVSLRPTEFRLLAYFCQNPDRVVGHQELLTRVWGEQAGSQDSLKWYVRSLREKIEEEPGDPQLIVNVPGVGYRYRRPEGAEQPP